MKLRKQKAEEKGTAQILLRDWDSKRARSRFLTRRRLTSATGQRDVEHTWVYHEPDRWIQIRLRVQLAGRRQTEVAAAWGYRDGSGVHRVVRRLEAKARSDPHGLARG